MADEDQSQEDKTEDATPEKREDFRDKGQVALSSELTSVAILAACIIYLTWTIPSTFGKLEMLFTHSFEQISTLRITKANVIDFANSSWLEFLKLVIPIASVTAIAATFMTLGQTQLNWSWERLNADFSRLNPISGLARMFSKDALVEALKSSAQMFAVGIVAYLILKGEMPKLPMLMHTPVQATWVYFGSISRILAWSIAGFLLVIAAADYFWNFRSLEQKLKMTKQEVKEDIKKREIDQHVKAKQKRMQRDVVMRKTMDKTRTATVILTNPTHYSIALRYEPGDSAPILVAKGIDFIALKMREVAKEEDIPIIENRPLARELYATVKEGEEIPEKFYRTVAEIIRYVFRIKGRRLPGGKPATQTP